MIVAYSNCIRSTNQPLSLRGALLLSSCPGEEYPRDCEGFNHPAVSDWAVIDVGQSMRFADETGDTVTYELVSVESTAPGIQYASIDDSKCVNDQTLTFSTDDAVQQIVFEFRQFLLTQDEPPEQSSLTLRIYAKVDDVSFRNLRLLHTLYVNESEYERNNTQNFSDTSTAYFPTGIVNGIEYQSLITSEGTNDSFQSNIYDSGVALSNVAFAKEFGLIQIRLRYGPELNRVF